MGEETERYRNSGENSFILYLNWLYLPRNIRLFLLYFIVKMEM